MISYPTTSARKKFYHLMNRNPEYSALPFTLKNPNLVASPDAAINCVCKKY